jgi:GT2 family glycosyltransferase
MTSLSIIIVSYNTQEYTLECLRSIYEQTKGISYEIIVVDNASSDGSAEAIEQEFPLVKLIKSKDNQGFAAANNIGFSYATGRYLLLLNSDTVLVGNVLSDTLQAIEGDNTTGVLGCRAFLSNGKQQNTFFRKLTLSVLFINIFIPAIIQRRSSFFGRHRYIGIDLDNTQEVDAVSGCFMLIRRKVVEQAGVMDTDFFFYGEEAEWCYRIRKCGWRIIYYPGARIIHYGGGSSASLSTEKAILSSKAQVLYLEKTQGKVIAWIGNLLMLTRDIPRFLTWWLLKFILPSKSKQFKLYFSATIARLPFQIKYSLTGKVPERSRPESY